MLILLIAIAAQASTPTVSKKPDSTITVTGKSKRVCFQTIVTGSRARGGQICRSKEEADAEAVASREAAREGIEMGRVREALRCDALSNNGCK